MEMISRQKLITAKYPKNLLYMVIQFDFGYDIFDLLPIEESVLVQNLEKVFREIRYRPGSEKLTHINRSIQVTMMYFKGEIGINQICNTFNISSDKVKNHINFVLTKLRNPMYWHMIIYGELGQCNNEEVLLSDDNTTSNSNDTSEMDFAFKDRYMRTKKYPKSLYYDIFGYDADYDAYTYITPEDSTIQKHIDMALEEIAKNNPYDTTHEMIQYLIMYYRDGMSLEEIARAHNKRYAKDIDNAINCIIRMLRTPRYSYILSHGTTNPDYANIERGIYKYINLTSVQHSRLLNNSIFTIDDLVSRSREDLLELYGIGPVCVKKIEDGLSSIGLRLNMDKLCKKYAYKAESIDMIDKLIYGLSYEDACKLLLQIRTSSNSK